MELVLEKNGEPILKRSIEAGKITIGRDPTSDIQLFDPEISRLHCTIEKQNGHLVLKDSSRNGTFVNSKKIFQSALRPTDIIQIGPWHLKVMPHYYSSQTTDETVVKEKGPLQKKNQLGEMLGVSQIMQTLFERIRKAAEHDATVCLMGESGTGKELSARSVHNLSSRRTKPFVAVNCGAIPENLIESILFGHEKGSFTGATEKHTGVFEEASGGTLFLDEIGEMPLELQTRLLRVLETQTLRRVGGKIDIKVNVRLIAATNKNLKECVANGAFRQDLFFRIYVFPIELEPLRKMPEEIEPLTKHFLEIYSPHNRKVSLSNGAIQKLKKHAWPGNIRELKNTIQRALILATENTITEKDLEMTLFLDMSHELGEMKLWDQEKVSIMEALRKSHGNHAEAARQLGIARSSLASKLRRHKIDPKMI